MPPKRTAKPVKRAPRKRRRSAKKPAPSRWRRRSRYLLALALPALALALWDHFFLRLDLYADATASPTIEVPAENLAPTRPLRLGPANPYWTPLHHVPSVMIDAVLKAEDEKFLIHDGFDWEQLRRAIEHDLREGRFARGGSTITMQLAKNLYLWREKSLLRKALEAYATFRLESALTKERILELYLNAVEWGPGIYGIGEASRHYFDLSPRDLGLEEAALLAAILPNPRRWNPKVNEATASRRQRALAQRLQAERRPPGAQALPDGPREAFAPDSAPPRL